MIKKNEQCASDKMHQRPFFLLGKQGIMIIMLLSLITCSLTALPDLQQKVITGKVTDSSGNPLSGVNVVVKGTTIGLITGIDGTYSLSVPSSASILSFSFIGYTTSEITVGSQTIINMVLTENLKDLGEIVVVGYGTQKKSDVSGSVASFKTENIQKMPPINIMESLQGNVAGLNITQTASDAEGNSIAVQIRGQNSITANNSPLVIIDGIPYAGQLSEINPVEIASIEILKDASSAAIYGARAANGVILLTTKKGASGKPLITYDSYFGIEQIGHLPEMMDGPTFLSRKIEVLGQAGLTNTELVSDTLNRYIDWINLATRTGSRHQQSISISGGTDKSNYYVSGTFNNIKGIAINDDFSRYNLRINIETTITDWLSFGTNTTLGYFDRSGSPADFAEAFVMNPLAVPYEADGTIMTLYPWPEDTGFANPLEPLKYINENNSRQIVTNNFLLFKLPFIKGLSFKLNTGYTFRNSISENYRGRNTQSGYEKGGISSVGNNYYQDGIVENIINYQQEFGKHSIFLTGLYSAQRVTSKSHSVTAEGFPNDVMTYYQPNKATLITPSSAYSGTAYLSQMFRANYAYDGRYLLTLTARRDGYSAFGEVNKFGIFPSVAVGWNLHSEDFMSNYLSWLSRMKVRLSYGENGNQAIGAYSTLPRMSSLNYLADNHSTAIGFYPSALGDQSLSWETTKSLNFGLDFGFLNNRIQGSFDAFLSHTYDLLLDKTISPVNGTTTIRQNIGETKNRGFEMQVSSVNVERSNFRWTTDLTFSRYKNEIINVGLTDSTGNYIDDIGNTWFIGSPVDVNFGYIMDGIWQDDDDIANSHMPAAHPGDIKIKDADGNGAITPDDRRIIGSLVPSYTLGITNNLTYKNLTLTFFVYALDGVTRRNSLIELYPWNYRHRTLDLDFWTAENRSNSYPRNDEASKVNPYSAAFYEDASFLRLKDITLSYQFPVSVLERLKMTRLECYVNVKNIATLTKWQGLDPELNSQAAIPLTRTFIFGIRLGL